MNINSKKSELKTPILKRISYQIKSNGFYLTLKLLLRRALEIVKSVIKTLNGYSLVFKKNQTRNSFSNDDIIASLIVIQNDLDSIKKQIDKLNFDNE